MSSSTDCSFFFFFQLNEMDGAISDIPNLEFCLNVFESFSWLFVYHGDYPSDQHGFAFSLVVTFWGLPPPIDLMPPNACNCRHRNMKLFGDGQKTFSFNMLICSFASEFPRQLCPFCSVWYT